MLTAAILTGGHESRAGADLAMLSDSGCQIALPGQELQRAVADALQSESKPISVVPMTLGRDPALIADTARTLQWLNRSAPANRIVLTEPFGSQEHLIGWLRRGLGRVIPTQQPDTAAVIWAPAAGPFDDADLFRVARLVSQYQRHQWVEVAFAGGKPDIATVVDRCRRLGAKRIVSLPANFSHNFQDFEPGLTDIENAGPLLTEPAAAQVIVARVHESLQKLTRGDNGIHLGLHAEHGHGHSHSHKHDHSPHSHHTQQAG